MADPGKAPTSNELAQQRTDLAGNRTQLADERTGLAVDRTRLAHERTLMAWVRTATSLISFGFTVYKFFQYMREGQPTTIHPLLSPRLFGLMMIGLGLTALILATIEHRHQMQLLQTKYRTVRAAAAIARDDGRLDGRGDGRVRLRHDRAPAVTRLRLYPDASSHR